MSRLSAVGFESCAITGHPEYRQDILGKQCGANSSDASSSVSKFHTYGPTPSTTINGLLGSFASPEDFWFRGNVWFEEEADWVGRVARDLSNHAASLCRVSFGRCDMARTRIHCTCNIPRLRQRGLNSHNDV